jgi:hypothetical protein
MVVGEGLIPDRQRLGGAVDGAYFFAQAQGDVLLGIKGVGAQPEAFFLHLAHEVCL